MELKRSTRFDVMVSEENRKKIIESIRLYRAACRKAFSACAVAEMAGASIIEDKNGITIKPNSSSSKKILEETFDIHGKKAHLYELRTWIRSLHPSWLSIVPEAIHRTVSSRWRSPDPEFPKAKKGWLVLNGARKFGGFMHAGIEIKNTIPKLENRHIAFKWDSEIGEVQFKLARLDGSRHSIWRNLRDHTEGWKLGTMFLNERDGKIFITTSYTCPSKEIELDSDKTLEIVFSEDPSNFITMKGSGNLQGDCISAEETIGLLHQLKIKAGKWEARRRAIGNPRRAWGDKKAWKATQKVVGNVSNNRKNVEKDRNHLWTRRIVERAKSWSCGRIVLGNVPDTLFGEPWGWYQFKSFLEYKITEIGGVLWKTCPECGEPFEGKGNFCGEKKCLNLKKKMA